MVSRVEERGRIKRKKLVKGVAMNPYQSLKSEESPESHFRYGLIRLL